MAPSALNFTEHPLIGQFCVPTMTEHVIRYCTASGKSSPMRACKAGSLVMLRPDPETNPTGDKAWFGVVTWIEPKSEVRAGRVRQCEIWWVYTRKNLKDIVKSGKAADKKELVEYLYRFKKNHAWVSNHFSDEPLDSIMTIPGYMETFSRIKLDRKRYLEVDTEIGSYAFVEIKS